MKCEEAAKVWYLRVGRKTVGPVSVRSVRKKVAAGTMPESTEVRREGMRIWVSIWDVDELTREPSPQRSDRPRRKRTERGRRVRRSEPLARMPEPVAPRPEPVAPRPEPIARRTQPRPGAAKPSSLARKLFLGAVGCFGLLVVGFVVIGIVFKDEIREAGKRRRQEGLELTRAQLARVTRCAGGLPAREDLKNLRTLPTEWRSRPLRYGMTDRLYLSQFEEGGFRPATARSDWYHSRGLLRLAEGLEASRDESKWDVDEMAEAARALARKNCLAVFYPDELDKPKVLPSGGWAAGRCRGTLVLMDLESGKPVGWAPLEAHSAEQVKTGGGVGVRFRFVPVTFGNLGGTDLEEAIQKDFKEKVIRAMKTAVASMTRAAPRARPRPTARG